MAILASLGETMPEALARDLIARGIVPLSEMSAALEAIAIAARVGRANEQAPLLLPTDAAASRTLNEAEAKAALAAHGVRVPLSIRAASVEAAAEAAAKIGFPVALKGEGIAHKTEAGAVALNLQGPEAVRAAAKAMSTDRFLVEEMVTGTVAELLIGVVRDPAHGYVLTLAAGGVLTELLQDSASLLVPASRSAVAGALKNLRIAPVLEGYRGAPAANLEAILDSVMAVQDHVTAAHPQEVEINPLLCTPAAAIAADALIKAGE